MWDHMLKLHHNRLLFIYVLMGVLLALTSYASPKVYLDQAAQFTLSGGSPNSTLTLSANLTLEDNINHTFEGRSNSAGNLDVIYMPSNSTNFLLRFRIDDEAGTVGDIIQKVDCVDTSTLSPVCDNGCGGNDFSAFHRFDVIFNLTSSSAKIFIDGTAQASIDVCTGITQIGSVRFSRQSGTIDIRNVLVTADNKPPQLIANLSNITWPEDTSFSFNISGNFSDANNDNLKYTYMGVENISISINNDTGIVNLTPAHDFYGINYVIFIANDSEDINFSNNVTLTVTNVNDAPNVTSTVINNTDFLNRTNGTLIAGWAFSDVDNATMESNEILWYNNSHEVAELINYTTITSSYTKKNQNWSFSVRVFDGTDFSAFVNSTSLIIQNSAPIHTIPSITSNDEHKRLNGTLTCSNQSTLDLDMDTVSNFAKWYKNNILIETAINLTTLSVGNYTKGDNLTCEITPNDGYINGTSLNSTNFTVLNAAPLLNNSLQIVPWDEDTSATINLLNGFVDIDDDNMTYNFTDLSNIAISVDNNTGVATLTPDQDFNGVRYVIFFAFDGINLTSSNNVTLTVNDVQEPSSGGTTGGGGGGGGSGGGTGRYTCKLDWECTPWAECENGKQARECKLVDVSAFTSLNECPQKTIPEMERICETKAEKKATCSDGIRNQGETGTDCGGPCGPCFVIETKEEKTKESAVSTGPTGAVVGAPFGNAKKWGWLVTLLIIIIGLILYNKLRKKTKRNSKG